MTKKILAALLAVMMLVSMLPATFAVDEACPGVGVDHSKDNCANYEAEGDYVEVGCCTPGYQLYRCLDCGEHFASDIDLNYTGKCEWELKTAYVAPTCTEAGTWAEYVCKIGKVGVKYTGEDEDDVVNPESEEAKEAIAALGHDFGDITDCHEGKVCERCDYAEEHAKHSWEAGFNYDDIVIDVEPGLNADGSPKDGEFHYECSFCGQPSDPHTIVACNHQMTWVPQKDPKCNEVGIKAHFECSVCNKWYIELFPGTEQYVMVNSTQMQIECIPHTYLQPGDADYEKWYSHIDPTCQTNGYTWMKCTVCLEWVETNDIPANDDIETGYHSWFIVEPAVEGTCEQEGKTALKICTICRRTTGGDVIPGTGKGHNEQTITVAGTCISEGYTITYCANDFCTLTAVKSLKLSNATTVDLTQYAADGLKVISGEAGETDPINHNMGWVLGERATCQAGGFEIWMCQDCLDPETAKFNPATGKYNASPRYNKINLGNEHCVFAMVSPASCTEDAVWECIYCDRQVNGGDIVSLWDYDQRKAVAVVMEGAAYGHNYEGQTILREPPKCTDVSGAGEDGYTYQECKNGCGEINKLSTIPFNNSNVYFNEADAKEQHQLPVNYEKVIYSNGSCAKGDFRMWKLGQCEICKRDVLLADPLTGNGHSKPTDGSAVEPTCTVDGYFTCQNSWCTNIGKLVVEPAVGHTLNKVEAVAPDCVHEGNYEYYECTREDCGAIFTNPAELVISDDKLSVTLPFMGIGQDSWIAPEGGKFAIAVGIPNMSLIITEDTLDGTYTLRGNTEYTFIIKDGKFEAALAETTVSQVIPALGHGHEHTEWCTTDHGDSLGFIVANPYESDNCLEFTYENTKWCACCYYSAMYGFEAAEDDHNFSDKEEDMLFEDCMKDLYFACQNENCSAKHYVEGTRPGHKNSDGDYFLPGCLDKEDNRHCVVCCEDPENCTGIEGECLISNAHDYKVQIDDAPATCDQPGYDLLVCSVCGYEHIVKNEDKHEHLNGAAIRWTIVKPASFTEEGFKTGVCTLCGEPFEETIPMREGIGFELDVVNADAPGFGYTASSLIEVTVSLSTSEEDVALRGFTFILTATNAFYVGYDYVNTDFDVKTVTTPKNAHEKGFITVNGMASNERWGEEQNVPVEGKNAVVKFYFRATGAGDVEIEIPSASEYNPNALSAWLFEYDVEDKGIVEKPCQGCAATAEIRKYMDITHEREPFGPATVTMTDVLEAYEMITNPEEGEATYSVVMDVDKDGVVTTIDLIAIMEYLANNAEYEEMWAMGIDAGELDLIKKDILKIVD